MQDRIVALEGVQNFRDFGGYETADGGRVATGLLFRSAHFARATDSDIARLEGYAMQSLTDLRRPEEREREPNIWPGAGVEVITSDEGQLELPPHLAVLLSTDLTPESVAGYMHKAYAAYPYEARYVDLFRRFLRAVLTSTRPVVVHCAAGKDRTGMACALVHAALGVPRDAIFADYELTNTAVDLEARLPFVQANVEERIGRKVTREALWPMIGVHADYLAAAFDAMESQHGSIIAYMEAVLGIGEAERAAMRARLVV